MPRTAPPQPAATSARPRRPVPAQIARRVADTPALWRHLVRFDAGTRFATRLPASADDHEIWLLTWLPGRARCGTTTAAAPVPSPPCRAC